MDPGNITDKVLQACGFPGLNPVQEMAIRAGVLDGKSMVVAAPTASGKTLVSELAMLRAVMSGKKALYIVPLKALASEKYNEFKQKYEPSGFRIAMSVGDKDSSDPWLAKYDVIIVTSEKLDSLIRHGATWLGSVGLVVADEIHLIDSPNRGPTLEVILTRLRQLINPQILALSATISNHDELAEWLQAEAVKSDYRPVKLYNGLFLQGKINWHPKRQASRLPVDMPPVFEIAKDTAKRGKQALVFVSTRKRAESLAEKLGEVLKHFISPLEKKELVKLSGGISSSLEHPTRQCARLAKCLQNGAVFHHAGLVAKQRRIIEDSFRQGKIKVICATPTLAAGINMPAFRVIVRDLRRFSSFRGMDYIPVLEIQQMMGRAGRPAYDTEGEAILIAGTPGEAKKLWQEYIKGEPEKIVSKLGVEPVLRMHALSLVATEGGTTKGDLLDFFSQTFYAHQYKDMGALERELEKVLEMLAGFKFITRGKADSGDSGPDFEGFRSASSLAVRKEDEELKPTRIGKRVAELYIDPLTANHIIESLGKVHSRPDISPVSILHILSQCLEMKPGLSVRKRDMQLDEDSSHGTGTLLDFMLEQNKNILGKIPEEWDVEYDEFLRTLKLTWMLNEWTNEVGEDMLLENFGVTPGELRARVEMADWLFYSMQELGLLLNMIDVLKHVRQARLRVKYGIRAELLPLVKLRQVGRVRARMLFDSGYRSLDKLRGAPVTAISQIVGPGIAKSIVKQLQGPEGKAGRDARQSQGSLHDLSGFE